VAVLGALVAALLGDLWFFGAAIAVAAVVAWVVQFEDTREVDH
jgi:hypothetical protein